MANLRQVVRDELVEFDWSYFGLDAVDEADTEWADSLAELIVRRVAKLVAAPPKVFGPTCTCPPTSRALPHQDRCPRADSHRQWSIEDRAECRESVEVIK
jgi:hypothetical protein